MAISTNPKPTIYRNLYENTAPGSSSRPIYAGLNKTIKPIFIKLLALDIIVIP